VRIPDFQESPNWDSVGVNVGTVVVLFGVGADVGTILLWVGADVGTVLLGAGADVGTLFLDGAGEVLVVVSSRWRYSDDARKGYSPSSSSSIVSGLTVSVGVTA